MDSTGPSAAPTALYTNAAPPTAKPPSSTPSRPPSGGNSGNDGHRNKNNNKNHNDGHGGGNNGRNSNNSGGRNSSSGQTTTPTASDGRTGTPWPIYGHPWQGHMSVYPSSVPTVQQVRRPSWPCQTPICHPGSYSASSSSSCCCSTSRPLPLPQQAGTLGQRGLGPAIASPLLQHHGTPPTSDFSPGLGGRLRRDAPHHSVSW
jgi:hypothetical protein